MIRSVFQLEVPGIGLLALKVARLHGGGCQFDLPRCYPAALEHGEPNDLLQSCINRTIFAQDQW